MSYYNKEDLKQLLNIDEATYRFLRAKEIIPEPEANITVERAKKDLWSPRQVEQIKSFLDKFRELQESATTEKVHEEVNEIDRAAIEGIDDISQLFISYGESNPTQLFYFIGVNPVPGLKKARALGTRVAENGTEFLIGFSGSNSALNQLKKKIGKGRSSHARIVTDGPVIEGVDLQVSAVVNNKYINKILDGLQSGFADYFSPSYFADMGEVFEWELVKKQTPQMTKTIRRYKARAERELPKLLRQPGSPSNSKKVARYTRILDTINKYLSLPVDKPAFESMTSSQKSPSGKYYRARFPASKRFPAGWRPLLARSENECDIVNQMAELLGCELPSITTTGGRKNPIELQGEGYMTFNGHQFKYVLDVVPFSDVITSRDDNLNRISKYPDELRPAPIGPGDYEDLAYLRSTIAPIVMVLPGPTDDGPPIVWGKNNYVLEGNIRVIALRSASSDIKSKYLDYVFSITGKRGLLVKRLVGDKKTALDFVSLTKKAIPVKNPILMVGNPDHEVRKNPMLMVGNPIGCPTLDSFKDIKYKKKGNNQIPIYPKGEGGFPIGAVPIDQVPNSVKNHETFSKSAKMFKDRYGADPDYAIPVGGPKGIAQVLAGVGQLKQLDYWAAEDSKKPDEWIHWYHEAGERGEGKPFTRACIVAADPHTGGIILVSPEGADVKFTNRGIVG